MSKKVGYNRIYARINVANLRYNIETMKSLVKPDMKVLIIVKADAYGHGAVEVAKFTEDMADYYGVATIDEAIELRAAGVRTPILIIGYTAPADYGKVLAYDITQTVYNIEDAKKLSDIAIKRNKKARIHIKVDTGMSRIGFLCDEEGIKEASKLKELNGLNIEGIFTHYAKADETDKSAAALQKKRFLEFISGLEKCGISIPIKHIDNSAGIMELDDNEFDMVRSGISTYGVYPSEEVSKDTVLKPVMSLVSHVAHIKDIPAGVGVSYGWTYTTDKTTKVATVTAGYADGYPRALSNKGRVIINGQYAPIIGRVCMDQFMVDVTELNDVNVGDEVVLFGRDGELEIPVEEVAAFAGSFNYEQLCNVSRRVARVYENLGEKIEEVKYLTDTKQEV